MCRFFAIKGDFQDDLDSIFKAIQSVAFHDELFEKAYSKKITPNHPDGWGLVNYNGDQINLQKFKEPIFNSKLPNVMNGDLIVHARKASKNQPLGALNAHPFHRSLKNSEIFMVHNGGVKKELLKVRNFEPETHTDTETFLFSIRDKGDIIKSLSDAVSNVDKNKLMSGALNLAILNIDRYGKSTMFAYSDYSRESDFIKLHFVTSDKWSGVFSSSIVYSPYFPDYESDGILNKKQLYIIENNGILKV